jgi:Na+/H+-dicarboxylate symporter
VQSRWFTLFVILAAAFGWVLGNWFTDIEALAGVLGFLKTTFLSALKMVIAPLIFFSLISGIFNLKESGRVGRLGAVTLTWYLSTTAIAIAIGLGVVLFVHPWSAMPPLSDLPSTSGVTLIDTQSGSVSGILRSLAESMLVNPFTALADLNILGIVTNALAIGLAGLLILPRESAIPGVVHEITRITYKLASWAVLMIPLGVIGIVYEMTSSMSLDLLEQLLTFAAVVFGATLLHGVVVLPLLGGLVIRCAPWDLLRRLTQPMMVAFTTSSSAATLPVSMACAERELGVGPSVRSFVLPLGATINMDGTALFEGMAAVFLAYLFGIELGAVGTVTVFLLAMLASVGAPGIPSGSLAGMQMVLLAVGIPLEAIAILLLIERPLDTFRTAVNVEGDLIGSAVIEHIAGRGSGGDATPSELHSPDKTQ